MSWIVNVGVVLAAPAILYWQYHDVKDDFAKLEAQIEAKKPAPEVIEPVQKVLPRIDIEPILHVKESKFEVIKTSNKIHATDKDVFCMAKNIYHEAAYEPELGKYAVAQITLNRKYNPRYPKSICSVILEPYQFSWANNHKIRWTKPKGRAWEESIKIAEDVIIHGYRVKGLESGMFYHADYVSPKWKDENAKIAKIGRHIFYSSAL